MILALLLAATAAQSAAAATVRRGAAVLAPVWRLSERVLPVGQLLHPDEPRQPTGGPQAAGSELPLRLVCERRGMREAEPLSGPSAPPVLVRLPPHPGPTAPAGVAGSQFREFLLLQRWLPWCPVEQQSPRRIERPAATSPEIETGQGATITNVNR